MATALNSRTAPTSSQIKELQADFDVRLRRIRERWGVVGMPEDAAFRRFDAINNLLPEAREKLYLTEPAAAREAAIQAVVRAHFNENQIFYLDGVAYEPDKRQCKLESCDKWFKVTPETLHKRYCSTAHWERGKAGE